MASAKISFEIEGVSHTLYFGMSSVGIFQKRSATEYMLLVNSGIETPEKGDFDEIKSFANLIYSGLCNQADILDEQRPPFIEAYELTEAISIIPGLAERISEVWNESRPVKDMIDRLKDKTAKEEKKSTNPKIGKKLKPMPPVS